MNKSLAIHYFKLAADQGDSFGQWDYGVCLAQGKGIPMNKSLAANYFKLSADQGNQHGQCAYGLCLLTGDGVPRNESLAAHYFKLSAEQGNNQGQSLYAYCLGQGQGIRIGHLNGDVLFHDWRLANLRAMNADDGRAECIDLLKQDAAPMEEIETLADAFEYHLMMDVDTEDL
jgi:TPR repeat protein